MRIMLPLSGFIPLMAGLLALNNILWFQGGAAKKKIGHGVEFFFKDQVGWTN